MAFAVGGRAVAQNSGGTAKAGSALTHERPERLRPDRPMPFTNEYSFSQSFGCYRPSQSVRFVVPQGVSTTLGFEKLASRKFMVAGVACG